MQLVIIDNTNHGASFEDLNEGAIFKSEGRTFMKTDIDSAIDLSNGRLYNYYEFEDQRVFEVSGRLVIS